MQQIIYGDVLFAVNFSMDFLSLYISGRITHERLRPLPMSAAAAIGALYGTASVFLQLRGVFGWIINVAVAVLMCFTAFDRAGFSALMRRTALFYGIGFLLGGAMTALYNLLNTRLGSMRVLAGGEQATLSGSIPLYAIVGLGAAAAASAVVISRILRKRKTRDSAEIEIAFMGRTVKMSALCDSGNLASEPLGGLPVIFVSSEQIKKLLPASQAEFILSGNPADVCRLTREVARRTRIVPLTTVAGSRTAIGLVPDKVTVGGAEKRACVVPGGAVFGDNDALIPEILV